MFYINSHGMCLFGDAKADAKADFEDPEQNPLWLDIENRAEDLAVEKWKKTRSNK